MVPIQIVFQSVKVSISLLFLKKLVNLQLTKNNIQ